MTITTPAPARARNGEWQADPGFGIYVHVPFCRHRCHYCDFNTYEGQDALHSAYVDALVTEIEDWPGPARAVTSIFVGGGTPTLLAPGDLGRILLAIRARFDVVAGAEATVEANPETVDRSAFEGLLEAGFNRFSVGVQSTVPHVLAGLGRTHSGERALTALRAARAAGVADLNADLIYGSPWESAQDWRRSLEDVAAEGPEHVSAYALTVEEGTPLATLVATGRVPDVDPDVQADRHATASELLGAAGYGRYEISNWAHPGRASRHNVLYWSAGDYLGFGAGAHSHVAGRRWWATRLPRAYIESVRDTGSSEAGSEQLDAAARAGEALMLGLRLAAGVDLTAFATRFGAAALEARSPVIESLEEAGLLCRTGGRLALTSRGTLMANEVAARLL